ncbi:MAG: outer membrane protein assembly factor BamA [Kangiellaceae bacterium]|nr:outer membrane protein assembly factor BamA [Kangiellaceae bacterium]
MNRYFRQLQIRAKALCVSFAILASIVSPHVYAQAEDDSSFLVEDIKVEGLQRMELGTFFNMLPLQVGERLEPSRVPTIIRTLFSAENFDDIRVFRDGKKLVIDVVERPTISEITIDGNHDIKTEQILDAMKGAGFAKGEIYNPSAIKEIIGGMEEQYFSHGKYSVKITNKVVRRSRNRVMIQFDVNEGEPAKIESIKIVGNSLFEDEELLNQFEITSGGWFSFITSDDQYAREKLSGDLEILRSYYLDRGYLKFNVTSTQVAISPDRKGIFITINVTEGEKYEVSKIAFNGDLVLTEKRLKQLMPLTTGDTYSAAAISFAEEQIKQNLGHFGYAFANVTSVPSVKPGENKVDINLYVDPGKKVYVNRINFTGNETTNDRVLRREARLMEGGALSTAQVDRTKIRLQRLTFVEEVEVETPKMEDKEDRVDINYQVKERSAGTISGGLGYGSTYGLSVNANVSHNNFLGSGKTVGFSVNKNSFSTNYSLNYFDPYFTIDEISAGASLSYRSSDFGEINIAATLLDTAALDFNFGYSINEITRLNFGVGYQTNDLSAKGRSSQQIIDFFEDHGRDVKLDPDFSYDIVRLSSSIVRSSLNRGIFPDRGTKQYLTLSGAAPGSDLEFYKLDYSLDHYIPISPGWSFLSRVKLSYGDGYGKSDNLPYFENFSTGGSSTVRGFERNTIGPREIFRTPQSIADTGRDVFDGTIPTYLPPDHDRIDIGTRTVGGNAKALASFELIFPVPFVEESNSVRTSFFVDAGNLWDTKFERERYSSLVDSAQYDLIPDYSKADTYRASTGISIQWLSPMGPLVISFSKILKSQEGDRREGFAFNVGQTF